MSKATKFWVTALTAAGVAGSAQATITILDFEDLALGSSASTQYAGLSFSSGNVAVANLSDPGGTVFFPSSPKLRSGPTFLMDSVPGGGFNFEILPGFQLNSLTLDVAANAAGLTISVVDVNGHVTQPFEVVPGGAFQWQWDNLILLPAAQVRRVEFSTGVGGRFALDHFQLDLSPGSAVPEPATAGLVALALIGVAAGRCRKQA